MITESLALGRRAVIKWLRNPFAVFGALFQALFWLLLFGNSFNPANALSSSSLGRGSLGILQQTFGGAVNYITYLTPGVIAIVSLTTMSYMGVDVVMDRVDGYLDVIRSYPIPRASIYLGAMSLNMSKAMATAVITFVLAFVVPNGLRLAHGFGALDLLGFLFVFALLSAVFAGLFTGIGIAVKSVDSFFTLANLLTFPIMFTSTALFPVSFFPSWMKPIAQANPVSLASNAARLLIVNGPLSASQASAFAADVSGLVLYGALFAVLGIGMADRALRAR